MIEVTVGRPVVESQHCSVGMCMHVITAHCRSWNYVSTGYNWLCEVCSAVRSVCTHSFCHGQILQGCKSGRRLIRGEAVIVSQFVSEGKREEAAERATEGRRENHNGGQRKHLWMIRPMKRLVAILASYKSAVISDRNPYKKKLHSNRLS